MGNNLSEQDTNALFAPLFSQGCVVATSIEATGQDHVRDEERALIRHATAKRRKEFLTGRECAHLALLRIHCDGPVLRSLDGRPIWPNGIAGSLSHCPSLTVAAVDFICRHAALGVDVEEDDPLPEPAFNAVFPQAQRESNKNLTPLETKACFCAKEAVFKAYDATKKIVDCRRVSIRLEPNRMFHASIDDFHCTGQWRHIGHLIAAMTTVPA
ncbi:4'-phosphopantetheinyl transferase superfamily protein [Bifidobacterium sp. ESL0704]|uniref:4'-phosphopantetheinyl transferase family protein n=1 Tax=Bifidobacterium sp. ESL0704 TaxID=2983219 RepID=UPI0023F9633D|nr:4'-phosphopantetheinyl transferase superfamily protein [Bifidobacterium sp. ESL0704]WEV52422.1 4'-phosphopantetheinyl transferase superfamily protein [Bifidobacterium sp. ESL0704]